MNEAPEDVFDNDACLEIPGKRELDLGTHQGFEFVETTATELYDRVRQIILSIIQVIPEIVT